MRTFAKYKMRTYNLSAKLITTSSFRIAVNWYPVSNQTEIYVAFPDFVKHNASVSPR